jgi:serine/threonine protein kinase
MKDVVEEWLRSGQPAFIEGLELMPRAIQGLASAPLVAAMGQAQAYYLREANNDLWILKKFLSGRSPDVSYIRAIQALIPNKPGLESGFERKVLSPASVSSQGYYAQDFANWLENAILMPMVRGCSWATLADTVRDGSQTVTKDERLSLCRELSEKVRYLEQVHLSHRDLSSTNVFVNLQQLEVHLIDWDSLYHSALTMPQNTTFGTTGYIAPFVKLNGVDMPQVSWVACSDRFSLAILNAEFLSLDIGSPLTGDGGAFDQNEIYKRGGQKTTVILDKIKVDYPKAFQLIERSLNATKFDECPSPDEWIRAVSNKASAKAMMPVPGVRQDFISVNRDAFVRLNTSAFVKADQTAFVRPSVR